MTDKMGPGMGKSDAMRDLAKKFGAEVKDIFDTVTQEGNMVVPGLDEETPIPWLVGQRIHSCVTGKDENGYDYMMLVTEDGTIFTACEQGQAGSIAFTLSPKAFGMTPEPGDINEQGLTPDEDGDLHSPAWYLDAFLSTREAYHEAMEKALHSENLTSEQELAQTHQLDDLLLEHEVYGTMVNKLFGSKAVEGQWNSSKVEADK